MHKTNNKIIGALAAFALVLVLITAVAPVNAATGIATTRHNLGSSNRDTNGLTTPSGAARTGSRYTSSLDEICVFCHTPHASGTPPVAPLWNKALPTPASSYTMYSSGTMQGVASLNAGSMSLACLSCHDGTQAMDNMINAPTSAASANYNSGGASLGGPWFNGTTPAPDGKIVGIFNKGTNLSGDHPVGTPYCGGGQIAVGNIAGCSDDGFYPAVQGSNSTSFVVGDSAVAKENMRIYGSNLSTATVECGSCHDPHNDANPGFLRRSWTTGSLCMACHTM